MDSQTPDFVDVGRSLEKPTGLTSLQESETRKDPQAYTEAVLEILQEFTSARIVDESWPRRIPPI